MRNTYLPVVPGEASAKTHPAIEFWRQRFIYIRRSFANMLRGYGAIDKRVSRAPQSYRDQVGKV